MQFTILRLLIHLTNDYFVFCTKRSSKRFVIAPRNILKKRKRTTKKKGEESKKPGKVRRILIYQ